MINLQQKSATATLQRYCGRAPNHGKGGSKIRKNQVIFNFHFTLTTCWGVQNLQLSSIFKIEKHFKKNVFQIFIFASFLQQKSVTVALQRYCKGPLANVNEAQNEGKSSSLQLFLHFNHVLGVQSPRLSTMFKTKKHF